MINISSVELAKIVKGSKDLLSCCKKLKKQYKIDFSDPEIEYEVFDMYFYIRFEYLNNVLTKNDYNLLFSNYKMAREIVDLYFNEIVMNETVLSNTVLCQIQDILIESNQDRRLKHFMYMKKPNIAKAILDQIKENNCFIDYQTIRLS